MQKPDVEDLQPYSWEPLRNENEIRLLTFIPANRTVVSRDSGSYQTICSLTIHDRSECPAYTAVSYTWGSSLRDAYIYCDGHMLPVTRNCLATIKAIQEVPSTSNEDSPYTVWIDAICINQDDTVERSAQVARMGDIYRQAQDTLIYLGERDECVILVERLIARYRWLCRAQGSNKESGRLGLRTPADEPSFVTLQFHVQEAKRVLHSWYKHQDVDGTLSYNKLDNRLDDLGGTNHWSSDDVVVFQSCNRVRCSC